jgi:hypothetical protein
MNAQLMFPVFIIDQSESRYSLVYVAATANDLDVFLEGHVRMAEARGEDPLPASRFYDSTGRQLSPELGSESRVDLRAGNESLSPFYLRRLATDGYLAIEQFVLDELPFDAWANALAASFAADGDNVGPARHRAWHRSRHIPLTRSH